uniref:Transposase n=1 Tax=Heterorhabditis bacteriophora TaxID=37862 RepID=A0A1I7XQ91_HETBA
MPIIDRARATIHKMTQDGREENGWPPDSSWYLELPTLL